MAAPPYLQSDFRFVSLIALGIVAVIFTPAILRSRDKAQRNNYGRPGEASTLAIPDIFRCDNPMIFDHSFSPEEIGAFQCAFFIGGFEDQAVAKIQCEDACLLAAKRRNE
jgi:hypothetical protein